MGVDLDTFLWNNPEIKAPPINKFKMFEKNIDLEKLTDFFTNCPNILSNQPELRIEAEYMSRIVYRMSRKFRNDIGFRYTRKTLVALRKYLNTTITKDINEFKSCLPLRYYEEGTYLPTKQMLQYLLMRLQTLMKFMVRILACSEDAAKFYKDRISRGQSWNVSLLALANHSKIWFLCKTLCTESACLYANLLPTINNFQLVGPEWLHSNIEFPKNLKKWLEYDLDRIVPDSILVSSSKDTEICDITEDDDVEFCREYNLDCEIINTPKAKSKNHQNNSDKVNSKQKFETVDIGENISRSELLNSSIPKFNKMLNKQFNKLDNKLSANIDISKNIKIENIENKFYNINDIKSAKDLMHCLKQEEDYRKTNFQKASSKNLGIMQWHAFKTKMQVYAKKLNVKNNHIKSKNNKHLLEKIKKEWRNMGK